MAWSLEVVRGRDLGRVYPVGAAETLLGNALNGGPGLDLLDQEGNSPRRMAGRHAALVASGQDLAIRDLESPGGTFVNRQRLLSGQSRRLEPGDVIQLGSVQLQVKRSAPAAGPASAVAAGPAGAVAAGPAGAVGVGPGAKASTQSVSAPAPSSRASATAAAAPGTVPGRLSIPFTLAGGAICKSWDDFLVLAAQHWDALRDELSSGRVADHLRRLGRPDLVPRFETGRSADDQLDEWLGRLPATRSSAPELDVYPEKVNIRAISGGGITRQALRVTNVGYRLLRWTARVEPAGTVWLRLRGESEGRSFATIDQTELPIEVDIPERVDRPLSAHLVLEGNGGTKRVEVRLERPPEAVVIPDSGPAAASEIHRWGVDLTSRLAKVPLLARVRVAVICAVGLRLVIALLSLLPLGASASQPPQLRLAPVAFLLVGVGALAGIVLALRRGERGELTTAGFAGGAIGLLAGAVCHALIQSLERSLGPWSSSIWAVGALWGVLGAVVALLSNLVAPFHSDKTEAEL
jgi:hypothetical protein